VKKLVMVLFLAQFSILSPVLMSSASAEAKENEDSNPYLEESSINVEENQPELSEFSDHESLPEEYKMDYSRESNPCDGICTQAAGTGLGAKTSDTAKSSIIKGGTNKIYGEVYSTGRAQDFFYSTFKGYGKTTYSGTKTPSSIKATVKVSATGAAPMISSGGSTWSILSASRQVASDSNSKSKSATANYSNVKIQAISTLTAIFKNTSYIKVSGVGSETWTEDIWFWY